jgi:hypothetical protein
MQLVSSWWRVDSTGDDSRCIVEALSSERSSIWALSHEDNPPRSAPLFAVWPLAVSDDWDMSAVLIPAVIWASIVRVGDLVMRVLLVQLVHGGREASLVHDRTVISVISMFSLRHCSVPFLSKTSGQYRTNVALRVHRS